MNIQLNFRNKIMLATIAVIVVTYIAGSNLIYKTNVRKAEMLTSRISEAKNIKALAQELKSINEMMKSRAVISSDSSEPSAFLSKIVDMANSCDIKVDSISAGNVVNEGPYKFLPCGITFQASYSKLKLFMEKIEKDKKYIKIESLDILAQTAAQLKITMGLSGFYFE